MPCPANARPRAGHRQGITRSVTGKAFAFRYAGVPSRESPIAAGGNGSGPEGRLAEGSRWRDGQVAADESATEA